MSKYLQGYGTKVTPQDRPIPGSNQVKNNAGGFAWEITPLQRLERFLILGSEGGTYYVSERKLTEQNVGCVVECAQNHGEEAVRLIVSVSVEGRAAKNDPAIFALAACSALGDDKTRRLALNAVNDVCRTGTHLFTFASFREQFGGWGRATRRAVGQWYTEQPVDRVAYQAVKYRQRNGWTHRDLLRLAHPRVSSLDEPEKDAVLSWIVKGETNEFTPAIISDFEDLQKCTNVNEVSAILAANPNIPREAIPTQFLDSPEVWTMLLVNGMPMTALVRNLGTLTRHGILNTSMGLQTCLNQLADGERIKRSRIHPMQVLTALGTYSKGQGQRSNWHPVPQIVDALDAMFYTSFKNVEPTGKRFMLALDVSGSMWWDGSYGRTVSPLVPAQEAAAMALVTANVEQDYKAMAFSTEPTMMPLSSRQRLDDVVRMMNEIPMGGTDCSIPMRLAEQEKWEVDAFVVYTDNETWAGRIHPSQALESYRNKMGIDAKLIVVGMRSNGFTIANPNDRGMLDVVGFDSSVPAVISEFVK